MPFTFLSPPDLTPLDGALCSVFFFFQAEDGIRYLTVTGVQTCALPILSPPSIVRSTIPDAVEGAVLRALAKVPADRYPTTALFAEALNMPSAATGAHRRATLDRAVRRPRSALWRIALWRIAPVAAVVVALAAYLAIRSARAGRGAAAGGLDPRHVAVLYFEDGSNGKTLG